MTRSRRKIRLSGLLASTAGAAMLLLEYGLYQRIDENGVLQESLFLPLGMGLVITGVMLVGIGGIKGRGG